MGQVEAAMATLRDTVRRHRQTLRQYLDTYTTFTEKGAKHKHDRNNPHNLTKEQLGLGDIENYPIADAHDALNGESGDRYLDLEGAISYTGHRLGQSSAFATPTAINPFNGNVVQTTRPLLEASSYFNAYGLVRSRREFRIVNVNTGEKKVIPTTDNNYQIMDYLPDASEYVWSVRDIAEDGSVSLWSTESSFFVPAFSVNAPTVELLDEDISAVSLRPVFVTGDFSTESSEGEHDSTLWAIYSGADPVPVWSVESNDAYLISVGVPTGVLSPDTEYRMEVIHVGSDRGPSDPGILVFTTREVSVAQPVSSLRGIPQATSLWPVFDVPSNFSVTGDTDEFLSLDASLYKDDTLVWSKSYDEEPLEIKPDVQLDYASNYRLELKYQAAVHGASNPTVLTFTTTTGGSRGYMTTTPRNPVEGSQAALGTNGRWLEVRGQRLRSHAQGDVLWNFRMNGGVIHSVNWSDDLDNFIVTYVPPSGSHRIIAGLLSKEGQWSGILTGIDLPTGTVVKEVVYHGLIDQIHRFSATTDDGVLYFSHDTTTTTRYLLPPTGHSIEGGFFTAFGDQWVVGVNVSASGVDSSGLVSINSLTGSVLVKGMSTMGGWGQVVSDRDPQQGFATIFRGDQTVKINNSLNILEVTGHSLVSGQESDANLRYRNPTILTCSTVSGIGFSGIGPTKFSDGVPVEVQRLSGPTEDAVLESWYPGMNEVSLVMSTEADTTLFITGFEYEQLDSGVIPELSDHNWIRSGIHSTTIAPPTTSTVSGYSTVPVPLLSVGSALAVLTNLTQTDSQWETLIPFYQ